MKSFLPQYLHDKLLQLLRFFGILSPLDLLDLRIESYLFNYIAEVGVQVHPFAGFDLIL